MLKQIFLLFFFFPFILFAKESVDYLKGRIPSADKRYATFLQALELMKERGVKTIVETGTARGGCSNCIGDGCATIIFADYATEQRIDLFSVDIDPHAIFTALQTLNHLDLEAALICSDSIQFLKTFNRRIDFLYLDSYDFDVANPLPSQLHHLIEIQTAYPYLTQNSIVMIDDCALAHGGKGKLAIEFLLQRGWKVLSSGYQVILVAQ